MLFVSFPDIEGFHNAVKAVQLYPHIAGTGVVPYRGKTKLHGTNAGVRVKNGEVAAQSRTQTITVKDDHMGFARWVDSHKDFFSKLELDSITIFGEWCGQGIHKGTAIQQMKGKIFAVFAIVVGEYVPDPNVEHPFDETSEFIHDPKIIDRILVNRPADIHVLPWYGEAITVDFNDRDNLLGVAESLNKVVAEVEPVDPWVKATFGLEGTCEGVVYYPYPDGEKVMRKHFSDLAFKAKGEKHKVVKTKESVQVDPEVAASIDEFVTMFVTDARCEQGVSNTGAVDLKNTGSFLKWLSQDVLKESVDELAASDLTWEQVQKAVQAAARSWYVAKSKEI